MSAFVAAYMFGMTNGIPVTHSLMVTADQTDPTHIIVTYRGGPDQGSLNNLTIMWPAGVQQTIDTPKVGDVYTATGANVTPGKDHIIVTGVFQNGASQVVLETWV